MAFIDVTVFAGVWSRIQLYEPMISESACDETSVVLWIQVRHTIGPEHFSHRLLPQAPSGEFVDLRWLGQLGKSKLAEDWNVRLFKSFAGIASCSHDGGDCIFTWKREIDYRPDGPPDVGKMVFLDHDQQLLQEDGVLAGDDYREVWRRLDGSMHNSFGGRCFLPDSPEAKGVIVVSGMHVGIAVRFAPTYDDGDCHSLANIFAHGERCPSASEQAALDNYFGLIACDGVVVCCSRPMLKGAALGCTVGSCMPGWSCQKRVHTHLPAQLQTVLACEQL